MSDPSRRHTSNCDEVGSRRAHGDAGYLCLAWVARNASRVAMGVVKLDLDWLGERASSRSTNGLNGLSSLNQNMKRRMRRGARQEASSNSFARRRWRPRKPGKEARGRLSISSGMVSVLSQDPTRDSYIVTPSCPKLLVGSTYEPTGGAIASHHHRMAGAERAAGEG